MKIFFIGIYPIISYYTSGHREFKDLISGSYLNYAFVIKDNGSHPTAYIGLELTHPFAYKDYDHIPIDLEVNGGLTYAGQGNHIFLSNDLYWIGWDYAHAGDYTYFGKELSKWDPGKKWKFSEVLAEVLNAITILNTNSGESNDRTTISS